MIEITADTLEEAYKKASSSLDCSIVDLDVEVIQYPSRGFLGLFSKPAIVTAKNKYAKEKTTKPTFHQKSNQNTNENKLDLDIQEDIQIGLEKLIQSSCFKIEVVEVKVIAEETQVYIKLDGEDAALMIGKEGYRYKALSYMLHNWIKIKYNYTSTLEIAEFLKTQDEMIENYVQSLDDKISQSGKAQTKPLDGILIKLALEKLRAKYPHKYVAIRTLKNGRKIIIINEYRKNK